MDPAAILAGSRPRSYLPRPLSPLIGRDGAVDGVAALIEAHRLVSLVGPAGCGKTRLAIAVAHRFEAKPGGAHLVELTDLAPSGVDDLAGAIADALHLERSPGVELRDLLARGLAVQETLIVFDNCEHLIEVARALICHLIARAPSLRVLVTSRQPVEATDERVWWVRPLPVPPAAADRAELAASPAVVLFRQRVAERTGRPVADVDLTAAASVCRALDGLPLAIELAAGRAPVLTVSQIDRMLADRFRVLADAKLVGPAHHRTLRGALDWSYRLLDADEQAMLRRLSVCRGGWSTETADALHPEAATLVAGLVYKSLAVAEVHTGQPRHRLLQSIADYAAERLAEQPAEADAARAAHAGFMLALADRGYAGLRGPEQRDWLRLLTLEQDNLRAAMGWLAEQPDGHDELRMAAALASFHHLIGNYAQGRRWLTEALARRTDAPAGVRVRAYLGAANLALLECDYRSAAELAAHGLAEPAAHDDPTTYGRLLGLLGSIERERGEYAKSARHLALALDHFRTRGDNLSTGRMAQLAGATAWLAGDLETAATLLAQSLESFRDLADDESYASTLTYLGGVAHHRGDQSVARALIDDGLDRFTALDFPEGIAWALNLLGLVELEEDRVAEATGHLRASLVIHRRVGDRWRTASVLEALARAYLRSAAPALAATLLGAADAIREAIGTPVPAVERPAWVRTVQRAREGLGLTAYRGEFVRGRAMAGGPALDELLNTAPGGPDAAPAGGIDASPAGTAGAAPAGLRHDADAPLT